MKRLELGVGGMSCAACSARVERALKGVKGMESAGVNLAAERANIVYDENVTDEAALKKAVKDAGYNPFDLTEKAKAEMAAKKANEKRDMKRRLIFAAGRLPHLRPQGCGGHGRRAARHRGRRAGACAAALYRPGI